MVWDEALPLGNGLLGALVWGDGRPLKISLDRTDLWDLRPVPEFDTDEYSYALMRRWVAEKRIDDLRRVYERPYAIHAGPTKIPAGRIELHFSEVAAFERARLDLGAAQATVEFSDGSRTDPRVQRAGRSTARSAALRRKAEARGSAGHVGTGAGTPGLRSAAAGRGRELDRL
jgi:hypothetical protein